MLFANINTQTIDISKAHLRIISETVNINPSASLSDISALLESMPSMLTCAIRITPEVLNKLGYFDPTPTCDESAESCEAVTVERKRLTSTVIRSQLEVRHEHIQERINALLEREAISANDYKAIQALAQVDDKLVSQILDLMSDESTPLLPQAILIACMTQLGVSEEDIAIIERT